MSSTTGNKSGQAWASSQAASGYLRARTPYPPYLINSIIAYHEHASDAPARWDAVLDLGCGPGQLSMMLSERFKHIYCRDLSEDMLAIARTLPTMDEDELKEVGLRKPPPGRTFDYAATREDQLKMPDNSVDLIIIGAAAHWFDWSSEESKRRIWAEWSRVLRKNGSVVVTGTVPALGNWTGPAPEKTLPLRKLLMSIPFLSELSKYYNKQQAELGMGTVYNTLSMPWDALAKEDQEAWSKQSRLFLLFDWPSDVCAPGYSPLKSDEVPDWMPDSIRSCITTSQQPGRAYEQQEDRWKTTTARRMAVWLRSSSGYVQHLSAEPEEKLRIGRDDDLAARLFKQACSEGGLGYDEQIEMHQSGSILGLRKSSR